MATTPTVPTTLLQAVNEMLAVVGTAQVMTLERADTNEEVQKAVNTINDVSVRVQSLGWHFNEEQNYPLNPDAATGQIVLPVNTLMCSINRRSASRYATMRAGKLYDLHNHTYVWANGSSPGAVTPQPLTQGVLYVDIRFLFVFEDVPQPIRWFIMAEAGQMWGVGRVPDPSTYRFTDQVKQTAEAAAWQYDTDSRAAWPSENPHYSMMRRR